MEIAFLERLLICCVVYASGLSVSLLVPKVYSQTEEEVDFVK